MGRRLHRLISFLGSDATTPPPSVSGAECATNPSSSSSLPPRLHLSSSSCQSKSCNAARPLVNRFICPSPAGAGATATATAQPLVPLPLPPQPSFDDDDDRLDDRDLLRRKKDIRFTRDPPLGLAAAAVGGRGGSGHAPPFLPQGLTFFWRLEPLRLIWPMQETLGDDGSGVRYPDRCCFVLPPPQRPRASGGTMETMGPEKALRWLKEDLPPRDGKLEEKEATVERKKEANPLLVKLLDLPCCFLCFFSMENVALLVDSLPCVRFVTGSMPFASGSVLPAG
ncbi:unnamed protein product [Urochloa humidicola]